MDMEIFVGSKVQGAKSREDFESGIFKIFGIIEKIKGPIAFIMTEVEGLKPCPIKFVKIVLEQIKKTLKKNMVLIVKEKLEPANKFLTTPLIPKEKVILLDFDERKDYLKVKHNKGKATSVFHKTHFEI